MKLGKEILIQAYMVEAPRVFIQSARESGKVVSPTLQPPLPQEILLVLIAVKD